MTFTYSCYGLTLASDIPLPELLEKEAPKNLFDIRITQGPVAKNLEKAQCLGLGMQSHADNLLLTVHKIAHYHMQQGSRIIVDAEKNRDAETIRNFLLHAALPYLLLQRGATVLRGVAFTFDEKNAHLILGHSGVGKSTVLAALCQKGVKFLTDSFVVLFEKDDGTLCIVPAFPQIKLWKDAIQKLQIEDEACLVKVRPNVERYYWVAQRHFYESPLPCASITVLREQNLAPEKMFYSVSGIKKIAWLHPLQFSLPGRTPPTRPPQHAKNLFRLSHSALHVLTKVNGKTSLAECVDLIANCQHTLILRDPYIFNNPIVGADLVSARIVPTNPRKFSKS